MKNQKGITLIALEIAIIVIVILAGISIAMLTKDNDETDAQKGSVNNTSNVTNEYSF